MHSINQYCMTCFLDSLESFFYSLFPIKGPSCSIYEITCISFFYSWWLLGWFFPFHYFYCWLLLQPTLWSIVYLSHRVQRYALFHSFEENERFNDSCITHSLRLMNSAAPITFKSIWRSFRRMKRSYWILITASTTKRYGGINEVWASSCSWSIEYLDEELGGLLSFFSTQFLSFYKYLVQPTLQDSIWRQFFCSYAQLFSQVFLVFDSIFLLILHKEHSISVSSSFFYYYLTSLYQKIATDTTTLSFVPKDQEIYDLFSIVESLLDHPSLQLYVYWVDVNIHELGSKQTTDPYKNTFSMLQDWYEPL